MWHRYLCPINGSLAWAAEHGVDQHCIARAAEEIERAQDKIYSVDGGDRRASMTKAVKILFVTEAPVKNGPNLMSAVKHVAKNASNWVETVQLYQSGFPPPGQVCDTRHE